MMLTEAFAAGTQVITSAITGTATWSPTASTGCWWTRPIPSALPGSSDAPQQAPERLREMGEDRPVSAQAVLPGPMSPTRSNDVYERAIEAPAALTAGERFARRAGLASADGRPTAPRRAPALARPAPGAKRQPPAQRSPPPSASASPRFSASV